MAYKDIMIDIETISTRPNAMMISLAAIKFDPFDDNSFNDGQEITIETLKMNTFCRKIDPESYTWDAHVDEGTLNWWSQQDQHILDEAFSDDNLSSIQDTLKDFYRWCGVFDRVWANGAAFDTIIIESACRSLGRGWPWKYHQVRDYRTVFKLVKVEQPNISKHHPLWDCWAQIVGLQRSLKVLGVKTFDV